MKNEVSVYSSPDGIKKFIESSINACDMMLEHYQFVLDDISSEISNPELQSTKGPAIDFLKSMMGEWQKFKANLQSQFDSL